ncbi:MAG: hypothetical protein JOY81_02255 [Alphaproteobacteria bacterium]|nr:hypothetical protein [Alphaproteobacteria bacterium]
MTLDGLALGALIILIFNVLYFQITSPTFLLVSFEVPTVTMMLRGQFWCYFLSLSVTSVAATLAFAVSGRLVVAAGIVLITAFAVFARKWFRTHMDTELAARDRGDRTAIRRLRRLHWAGMVSHAVALVGLVTSIPYLKLFPA